MKTLLCIILIFFNATSFAVSNTDTLQKQLDQKTQQIKSQKAQLQKQKKEIDWLTHRMNKQLERLNQIEQKANSANQQSVVTSTRVEKTQQDLVLLGNQLQKENQSYQHHFERLNEQQKDHQLQVSNLENSLSFSQILSLVGIFLGIVLLAGFTVFFRKRLKQNKQETDYLIKRSQQSINEDLIKGLT